MGDDTSSSNVRSVGWTVNLRYNAISSDARLRSALVAVGEWSTLGVGYETSWRSCAETVGETRVGIYRDRPVGVGKVSANSILTGNRNTRRIIWRSCANNNRNVRASSNESASSIVSYETLVGVVENWTSSIGGGDIRVNTTSGAVVAIRGFAVGSWGTTCV